VRNVSTRLTFFQAACDRNCGGVPARDEYETLFRGVRSSLTVLAPASQWAQVGESSEWL